MTRRPTLELVADFVNTRHLSSGADDLDAPERAVAWLAGHDLVDESFTLDEAGHADLVACRDALDGLAHAHGGGELDPVTRQVLNDLGARVSLSVAVTDDGSLDLRSSGPGVLAPIGSLLAVVRDAALDGTLIRLKSCSNDTCQWAFVDQSKNRSRRWCEMNTCGNTVNARAYRRRRRSDEDA